MIEPTLTAFYRLFGLASVLGLLVVGTVTLSLSVAFRLRDRYTERVLSSVRPEIVSRVHAEDPDWASWVAGLSTLERRIVRRDVYRQLRTVSGRYVEELTELAVALGMDEQAREQLVNSSSRGKLRGLARLSVLDTGLDPEWLSDAATTIRERAIVGRVLASDPDFVGPASVATHLLAPGRTLPGDAVHTLYLVMQRTPRAVCVVTDEWRTWDDMLVTQVLSVVRHTHDGSDALTAWVCACLEADAATVRMSAVNALAPVIERTGRIPDAVDVDSVLSDDSLRVRAAAFEQFAAADDPETTARLVDAALVEPSNIARLVAAINLGEALRQRPLPPDSPLTGALDWAASSDSGWSMDWQTPWELDWDHQPAPARDSVEPEPARREVEV